MVGHTPEVSPWVDKPRMMERLKYKPKLRDEEPWHTEVFILDELSWSKSVPTTR